MACSRASTTASRCHAADIPTVLARAWAAGVDCIILRCSLLVWCDGRSPEGCRVSPGKRSRLLCRDQREAVLHGGCAPADEEFEENGDPEAGRAFPGSPERRAS